MPSTSKIAEIGALLGDPARVNMMIALMDGRSLTARELSDAAGVTPQTASSHLAKLVRAGLLGAEQQGRHRYHRLASREVAQLLEQMHVAGASIAILKTPRTGPADRAMRELRSCYDHLAGRIAVEIASAVLLTSDAHERSPALSPSGEAVLEQLGLDLAALRQGRRRFCRSCLDWSERKPHIAGSLGAALLDRLENLDWFKRRQGSRSLVLTGAGRRGLFNSFGISC